MIGQLGNLLPTKILRSLALQRWKLFLSLLIGNQFLADKFPHKRVNVDSVVRTLISRGLVTELYTDIETGAAMFGTTQMLLEVLGINSLDELPAISPYLPDQDGIE